MADWHISNAGTSRLSTPIRRLGWRLYDPPNWYRRWRRRPAVAWALGDRKYSHRGVYKPRPHPRNWSIRARAARYLLAITDDRAFTLKRQTRVQRFLRLRCRLGRPERGWVPSDPDFVGVSGDVNRG